MKNENHLSSFDLKTKFFVQNDLSNLIRVIRSR